MFKGYAGAAMPRLQRLMDNGPTPNATIVDDQDPGSVGTALLEDAHDLQGCSSQRSVPGRRQRRVSKPKVRTRFARQLMSILSFSLQDDTTERISDREMATYECDCCKILDDEIKVGAVLLRLPESQLKTHLLVRADKLKKWTDF